jgi:hypothetical protein
MLYRLHAVESTNQTVLKTLGLEAAPKGKDGGDKTKFLRALQVREKKVLKVLGGIVIRVLLSEVLFHERFLMS